MEKEVIEKKRKEYFDRHIEAVRQLELYTVFARKLEGAIEAMDDLIKQYTSNEQDNSI
jgi:hypothetical protein